MKSPRAVSPSRILADSLATDKKWGVAENIKLTGERFLSKVHPDIKSVVIGIHEDSRQD